MNVVISLRPIARGTTHFVLEVLDVLTLECDQSAIRIFSPKQIVTFLEEFETRLKLTIIGDRCKYCHRGDHLYFESFLRFAKDVSPIRDEPYR